jgi:hypothetical protein
MALMDNNQVHEDTKAADRALAADFQRNKKLYKALVGLQKALDRSFELQARYYSGSWTDKDETAAGNARETVYAMAEELGQRLQLGAVYLRVPRTGQYKLFCLETYQF